MTEAAALKLVEPQPYCCCMPWHARSAIMVTTGQDEPFHGAACMFCDRAVAAPEHARGKAVACIYCGFDRGFEAAIEVPPFAFPPELDTVKQP